MAFGFVIERFDLFLQLMAPRGGQRPSAPHSQAFANAAGLAFVALGIAMIAIAAFRFYRTSKAIELETDAASPSEGFDLTLAALIGLLGVALFLYLSHAIFPAV